MVPFLPLALTLAKFVPDIVGLFKGNDAEEKARQVVGIAQQITGVEDPAAAVEQIAADPAKLLEFKEKVLDFTLKTYQEDTERLRIVNKTMQAEYETQDNFRGRWRPYWGYISGTAFGFQIFSIMLITGLCILNSPKDAAVVIDALARLASSLTATWTVALTVLGVAVWKRSQDKQAASGEMPKGAMGTIASLFNRS